MEAEMTINRNTQDLRIAGIDSLKTPSELQALCPASPEDEARIASFRHSVSDIIKGKDNRLLGIIGPCSIHDPEAAIDYASRLKKLSDSVSDVFLIVMRTYFESGSSKPFFKFPQTTSMVPGRSSAPSSGQ